MLKPSTTLIAAVCGAALSTGAIAISQNFSPNDVALGLPAYGGNGCPAGSVAATLSPDAKSLSLLFDGYTVEAGGSDNGRIDRKSCNIAIPVHVPQGLSVSLYKIDYRGYVYQPPGAQTTFNTEYFFAGSRGPTYQKTFRGPKDEDYLLTNNLLGSAQVWSACGADVNLRVNSSLRVRTNRNKQEAIATVDSADIRSGIKYHLQWKRCS